MSYPHVPFFKRRQLPLRRCTFDLPLLSFLALLIPLGTPAAPALRRFEPFDYRGVKLEDGPLLRQVLEVREDYLRVPNDDLLKPFRQRAGRPAPGTDLGGWYTPGTFHVFGQVLSGLARLHAATGDAACREKLNHLVTGWAQCLEPDGYFFSTRPPAPAHYIYEKMVGGLLDAHLYGRIPDALPLLDRITTWAEKNLDHSNPYVFNTLAGISEWYTLSENLYRAHLVTGLDRYRDFAKSWEYTRYWDLFAAPGRNPFAASPAYHAYSHVNTLNGAAMAYAVSGDSRYLDLVRRASDWLQEEQVFATGGYGPGERFAPAPGPTEFLDTMQNHFETQCGSWAGFKLAKHLITFTGDARHGDWIERLLLNGIGASLPRSGDGRVMYYAGYGPAGAVKTHNMPPWSCCAGTRIQAVADYHDLIYFRHGDALLVNLYTPSTVTWAPGRQTVTIHQESRFPEESEIRFRIELAHSETFALRFRLPAWLAGPAEFVLNDLPITAAVSPSNHWAELRREWRNADRVSLRLPMKVTVEPFPRNSGKPFPAALVLGPVVLAARAPAGNPVRAIDFARLPSTLVAVPGEPLNLTLAAATNDVRFRPLYQFKEGERYFCYLDPAQPWTGHPWKELRFSPGWTTNITEDLRLASHPGAYVEFDFTGTDLRWVAKKSDDGGRCEVRIDGQSVGIVDLYDAVRDTPFRHEQRGLVPGHHTVRLTVLPDRNPASRGSTVTIARLDALAE